MSNASLGIAILELTADGTKLYASLNDAEGKTKETGNRMRENLSQVGSTLTSLGGMITNNVTVPVLGVGAALTALGGFAISTGAEFEKAMSGVQAILGTTEEQAKKLSELSISLGMDPQLIVSASQAAGVMEELAKNGLTADQIMDGAARSAIALANATGTDFATAAAIASTAMQLFNLTAEDMASVVNNITGVANASRFSVEDFAQAMAMGGGVAAAMGIPIEDFATAVAGLSTSFSSGSDAGTSFKVFLQRLAPDTKPAIEAMKELGIITEEDGNRFFDAEGNMKSLSEIAGILQEAFKDLSDEQKILALSNIFGTDAMRAANAMAELGAEGFDKLAASMAKTDAAGNAATRMDNLAGSIEILGGIAEGFQIKFAEAFGPHLRTVVEAFSIFLSEHSGDIEILFTKLSDVFGKFAEAMVKGIDEKGPSVLEFLGKMVDSLPLLVDKLGQIGTVAGPAMQKMFDAIMSMSPETLANIGAVILALAALGPVLNTLGGIFSTLAGIMAIPAVSAGITGLAKFIGMLLTIIAITKFVLGLVGAFSSLGGILAALGAFILTPIGALLLLGAVIVGIYILFKNNVGGIMTTWNQLVFLFKYGVKQMVDDFTAKWTGIGRFLLAKVGEMSGNAKSIVDGIRNAFNINWSELGKKIIDGIVQGLKNGAKAVADAAAAAAKAALAAAKKVLGIKSPSAAFAEIGNFSGMGFAQGFARTLTPQAISGTLNRVVAGAAQTVNRSMQINTNIYNPTPEPASQSVDGTLKKLSYLGVIK